MNNIYLKDKDGNRVLIDPEAIQVNETTTLKEYIESFDNIVTITPLLNASEGVKIAKIGGKDIYAPSSTNSQNITIVGDKVFNTIADLKNATNIINGDIVHTKGFYEINDGGGSTFNVVNTKPVDTPDEATVVTLKNGLYADLMLPSNNTINFKQFGAKEAGISEGRDCKPYMENYLNFCDRYATTFKLFIQGGVWLFSATDLTRKEYPLMGVDIEGVYSGGPSGTFIYPVGSTMSGSSSAMEYLWRIGDSEHPSANNKISTLKLSSSLPTDYAYGFAGANDYPTSPAGSYYGTVRTVNVKLLVENSHGDIFDKISIASPICAIKLNNVHNEYFGWMGIMGCKTQSENSGAIMLGENIYNVYFDYFNYEQSRGTLFYGYSTNSDSLCQITVANLQYEGSGEDKLPFNSANLSTIHNLQKRAFAFAGHIGSPGHPSVLGTFSATKYGSNEEYNGTASKENTIGKQLAIVGHTTSVSASLIINNIFAAPSTKADIGPWIIYDTQPGGEFYINCINDCDNNYITGGASTPITCVARN